MRKTWLFSILVLALMATGVAPAYAYSQQHRRNNYKSVWHFGQIYKIWYPIGQPTIPAKPQPTIPQLPAPLISKDPGTPAHNLTADENYILQQTNVERNNAGLKPLQIDYRLVQTARAKSKDMIANNYFGHQSPTLGSPFDQMKKAGISFQYAGENIAGNSSAASAMTSWMNSSGHKANILNPNFTHIGIGVVDGGLYGKMFTQQFIS
jgi:uncharacterized YkwD family protein